MTNLKIMKIKPITISFSIILISIIFYTSFFSSTLMTNENKSDSEAEVPIITPKSSGVVVEWTWMMGNKTADAYGDYGTKGVPDSANFPGGRYGATSSTDINGNLWLFGGVGLATTGASDFLNDLWLFNKTSQEWTWISGNKTTYEFGVYGTKGDPDSANYPGGRDLAVSWIDKEGNFWLFGGLGLNETTSGRLTDLWRFNITSSEWTWMAGSKFINVDGVYGTKGDPDSANYPGSRYDSVSWNDTNGNLWLFGGWGHTESGSYGRLNDVWRYNITSSEWTWISGNKTNNAIGVYGTEGDPDSANYPGARRYTGYCTDTNGNLWIFGGHAEIGGENRMNELWRLNMTSYEWTWMSGSQTNNLNGVYGTKGAPNSANYPGGRYSAVIWADTNGDIWVFGGVGYPETGSYGSLNDLWKFDITSHEWTWTSGYKTLDQNGVYGTMGIPDSANSPGARSGSAFWTGADGEFYLFGGSGYPDTGALGFLNDLWIFEHSISKTTPLYYADDDDDANDDDDETIPFGNYYLLFVVIAIISLIVIIKRKAILKK